jgi:hypothetical protein
LPSCSSQSPRFNLREASLIDEMEVLSKLPRLVFPPLVKVYKIYSFCNYCFINTIALASSHRFFALQLSANWSASLQLSHFVAEGSSLCWCWYISSHLHPLRTKANI